MTQISRIVNHTRKQGILLFGIGLILLAAATATAAYAHAAVLWCYVENDQVHVEAFFMGGKKLQKGKILVLDAQGKKILEGLTDEKGIFSFTPKVQNNMTIVLQLDEGHGSDFQLTKEDFLEAAAAQKEPGDKDE